MKKDFGGIFYKAAAVLDAVSMTDPNQTAFFSILRKLRWDREVVKTQQRTDCIVVAHDTKTGHKTEYGPLSSYRYLNLGSCNISNHPAQESYHTCSRPFLAFSRNSFSTVFFEGPRQDVAFLQHLPHLGYCWWYLPVHHLWRTGKKHRLSPCVFCQ